MGVAAEHNSDRKLRDNKFDRFASRVSFSIEELLRINLAMAIKIIVISYWSMAAVSGNINLLRYPGSEGWPFQRAPSNNCISLMF